MRVSAVGSAAWSMVTPTPAPPHACRISWASAEVWGSSTSTRGAIPDFRSAFQQRKVRSGQTFQHLPPTRFVVGTPQQYRLGIGTTPKEAWPFQAQVDHTPHCTFDRPTPKREL